jgi:xanthine/uracil permease
MYESKKQAPLAPATFAKRLLLHLAIAVGLILGSLLVGMLGYSRFEHLSPLDSFLNSAMLLGGMGPVDLPVTPGGKLFAGLYALYAGLVFIATLALVFTPIVHRVLHKFHADSEL